VTKARFQLAMGLSILLNFIGLAVALCYVRWKNKNKIPLPPGPKGYPIIGNFFDWSTKGMWVKAHNWCQEYGEFGYKKLIKATHSNFRR
jgi:hypothetical protein